MVAFVIAFFDSSIKTIEEVEKLGVSFLGAIPTINLAEIQKKMVKSSDQLTDMERHKVKSKLVTHFSPKSPISEAYRAIRTNIQFSKVDNPPKVILVSSSIRDNPFYFVYPIINTLTGQEAVSGERLFRDSHCFQHQSCHRGLQQSFYIDTTLSLVLFFWSI